MFKAHGGAAPGESPSRRAAIAPGANDLPAQLRIHGMKSRRGDVTGDGSIAGRPKTASRRFLMALFGRAGGPRRPTTFAITGDGTACHRAEGRIRSAPAPHPGAGVNTAAFRRRTGSGNRRDNERIAWSSARPAPVPGAVLCAPRSRWGIRLPAGPVEYRPNALPQPRHARLRPPAGLPVPATRTTRGSGRVANAHPRSAGSPAP